MGTVWRARDLVTQQPVAVKILHAGAADQVERFAREAMLLADLAHASIVAYVAHGTTDDGVPYLAMEWLDGENVAERLARRPLTLSESLTLVRAAARGLTVAHRRGIVHRDLKPSNLFLRRGDIDDVVVLDLGIARHVGGGHALTRTGSILGTPSYMAPEQAQGHSEVGPAADVFSLGCVLFECLAGDPPFVGEHVFAVLAKVLFEEAPRLADLRPEMPAAIDALLERMLAKDPARRLPDAPALLAAIGALGGLPDLEPPRAHLSGPRPAPTEQELVSVILATPEAGGRPMGEGETLPAGSTFPDVSVYGGEVKRLADGTTVITLGQRGGAATDLAVRAARCALRVREGRAGWNIVLATGRGIPRERIYIGEAVDRAGRMLRASAERPGGEIGLDPVTAGLLGARFQLRRVDDDIYVLEGEEPSIDPARPLLGRPTACVGREQELGMLELALRGCVEESTPRAVLVTGLPGMGKSRLRHELLRRVQAPDAPLVLLGLGDPIRTSSTLGLLGGAVARLCGIRSDASEAENRAALEARVGRHVDGDRLRVVVFMGELCGVRYPADAHAELGAARHTPRIMADQIGRAWVDFARAEAAVRPVLLVLDDLQWSDALTVSLVDVALRELASSPFMALALARPEVQELFPDLWAPRLTVLPLRPLGAAATTRFVKQVLGDRIGDDSVRRIVSRAAGNALYLEELIRAAEAKHETVPETVVAMLQARIGLLPPSARRVLRAASVFGESFPPGGVEALLPDEELGPSLATLGKNEILEQQADERGGPRWRFRHVLMRDAAYGLLTAEDQAASHALAARFLETVGEDAAVIASHFERGGDRPGAVRHYTVAAEHAYRRADHAAAMRMAGQGLAAGAAGEDRGILLSIEAPTLFYLYDFASSWAASTEALALLPPGHPKRIQSLASSTFCGSQMGKAAEVEPLIDEMLAADPVKDDRAEYVSALGHASISHTVVANRNHAARLLDRIAAVDRQVGEDDVLVRGHARYWQMRFLEILGDDPYAAWAMAGEAVRENRKGGDRRMLTCSLVEVGECARRLFSVEEGASAMREAVRLAEDLREPITFAFMRQYLATLLAEHGAPADLPEARELARSVIELTAGSSSYRALGLISMALVDLREGDVVAAEAQAREARATMRDLGLRGFFPHVDALLLQVLLRREDAGAAALADEALATVDTLGPMGLMELPLRLHAARAHLAAARRDDAARGVTEALARLSRWAERIPDPKMRERFFVDVPEHAALRALAGELGSA